MPDNSRNYDILIIGAGPAGLMAAIQSAGCGVSAAVLESGPAAGRKLLLTGGGRCNLTNNCSINDFIKAFGDKQRFVRHCLYEFTPQDLQNYFAERGLPAKIMDDGCVFPETDNSRDVLDILLEEINELDAHLVLKSSVQAIEKSADGFVIASKKQQFFAKKVIIACGGLSYPQTGSTGDGYRFAQQLGHTIIGPKPVLVPLITEEKWPASLAGTSISNVKITATIENKKISAGGSFLFTQDGIGGPAVLDLSRLIIDNLVKNRKPITVWIDTVPDMNNTSLEKHYLNLCENNPKKSLKNIIALIFSERFASVFCQSFSFDGNATARQLEKKTRIKILALLKYLPLTITSARPIEQATITRGGICTKQINPKTFESLVCPGLYFAGEVIDVDGPCGGFNLQFAFSSGCLAGKRAAEMVAAKT